MSATTVQTGQSLLSGASSLAEHRARFGPMPATDPAGLLAAVAAAGLTGRGGAAFPTHRKLATVAAGRGRRVVVGNGAEGEPASAKDRTLLTNNPHLVLDGLALAARVTGAATAYLYVQAAAHGPVARAIAERGDAVRLVIAPDRFLAGEESAVAARLSGGAGLPTYTPPRVFERGVHGRPTLVQNVETLAQLALIARHGPGWFRSVGTPAEPGSMLVTVTPVVGPPRVAEVPIGSRLGDLVGPDAAAALIGGYHGAWLQGPLAAELPLSNEALRPYGASLGAGVVVALGPRQCGIAETARIVDYLAAESARHCGPCLSGLPLIAAGLKVLAGPRPHPEVRARLERWAGLVEGRGACHHPDGTVRLVRSALRVFAAEIAAHENGRCIR